MKLRCHRGFTLIEVVLVVALIALISGIGLQLPQWFASNQQYDSDTFALVTALYRARTLAMTMRSDSPWGVAVTDGNLTVFSGESYAERDEESDAVVAFTARASVSGASEVVFGKGTGAPAAAATVSLDFGDLQSDVTINAYGIIDYRTH
jgi:prepilin-type N-terminal cleavage/methylation domain-containing protein